MHFVIITLIYGLAWQRRNSMGGGIPVFKIFGITIRLHYSWFIIFALITWQLVTNFPGGNLSTAARIGVGLAASVLLFGSLIAHEVMHSVVAQASGIPVHSITLFIFGGVSQITKEPEKPGDEVRIALAGPLTSLVCGGLFFGIWFLTESAPSMIHDVILWLGETNVILAVFNLIPGFPLDGGRVLRGILWRQKRNMREATKVAANIGRGVGYVFIIGGIFLIFSGVVFQGFWIAFIGWFLENAAAGSYRQVALNEILQGHTASEVLTKDCTIVPPDITVQELVNEQILTGGRRCFPVAADNRVVGLITLNDVRGVPRNLWDTKKVSEAMIPADKMVSVAPNEDLVKVFQILTEKDINQVPVVEGGKVVGMIGRDALLAFVRVRADLGM